SGITLGIVATNVTVRRGIVSGWGNHGVSASASGVRNLLFEHLIIFGNTGSGIFCSGQEPVLNCLCSSNVTFGIYLFGGGEITDCELRDNGQFGIFATDTYARNCRAVGNRTMGIYLAGGTVSGCLVESNTQSGIYLDASSGSEAIGNTCIGNNT